MSPPRHPLQAPKTKLMDEDSLLTALKMSFTALRVPRAFWVSLLRALRPTVRPPSVAFYPIETRYGIRAVRDLSHGEVIAFPNAMTVPASCFMHFVQRIQRGEWQPALRLLRATGALMVCPIEKLGLREEAAPERSIALLLQPHTLCIEEGGARLAGRAGATYVFSPCQLVLEWPQVHVLDIRESYLEMDDEAVIASYVQGVAQGVASLCRQIPTLRIVEMHPRELLRRQGALTRADVATVLNLGDILERIAHVVLRSSAEPPPLSVLVNTDLRESPTIMIGGFYTRGTFARAQKTVDGPYNVDCAFLAPESEAELLADIEEAVAAGAPKADWIGVFASSVQTTRRFMQLAKVVSGYVSGEVWPVTAETASRSTEGMIRPGRFVNEPDNAASERATARMAMLRRAAETAGQAAAAEAAEAVEAAEAASSSEPASQTDSECPDDCADENGELHPDLITIVHDLSLPYFLTGIDDHGQKPVFAITKPCIPRHAFAAHRSDASARLVVTELSSFLVITRPVPAGEPVMVDYVPVGWDRSPLVKMGAHAQEVVEALLAGAELPAPRRMHMPREHHLWLWRRLNNLGSQANEDGDDLLSVLMQMTNRDKDVDQTAAYDAEALAAATAQPPPETAVPVKAWLGGGAPCQILEPTALACQPPNSAICNEMGLLALGVDAADVVWVAPKMLSQDDAWKSIATNHHTRTVRSLTLPSMELLTLPSELRRIARGVTGNVFYLPQQLDAFAAVVVAERAEVQQPAPQNTINSDQLDAESPVTPESTLASLLGAPGNVNILSMLFSALRNALPIQQTRKRVPLPSSWHGKNALPLSLIDSGDGKISARSIATLGTVLKLMTAEPLLACPITGPALLVRVLVGARATGGGAVLPQMVSKNIVSGYGHMDQTRAFSCVAKFVPAAVQRVMHAYTRELRSAGATTAALAGYSGVLVFSFIVAEGQPADTCSLHSVSAVTPEESSYLGFNLKEIGAMACGALGRTEWPDNSFVFDDVQ